MKKTFALIFLLWGYILAEDDGALYLDGNGSYMSLPKSMLPIGPTNEQTFSVLVWVRADEIPQSAYNGSIYGETSDSHIKNFLSVKKFGAVGFDQSTPSGSSAVTVDTPMADLKWHHIAYVQKGKEYFKLYIDGKLNSNGIPERYSGNEPTNFTIGGRLGRGISYFKGAVDDLSFWSTPLSETEISRLRNRRLSGYEQGLIAYWDFDENNLMDLGPSSFKSSLHGGASIQKKKLHNSGISKENDIHLRNGKYLDEITLKDGRKVKCKIISYNSGIFKIELQNGGQTKSNYGKILNIQFPEIIQEGGNAKDVQFSNGEYLDEVTLKDGRKVKCKIISYNSGIFTIKLQNGIQTKSSYGKILNINFSDITQADSDEKNRIETATRERLQKITIDEIRFQRAHIQDVISYLVQATRMSDATGVGVNIVLMDPGYVVGPTDNKVTQTPSLPAADPFGFGNRQHQVVYSNLPPVTLEVRDLNVLEVLDILEELVNLKYVIDGRVVKIYLKNDD